MRTGCPHSCKGGKARRKSLRDFANAIEGGKRVACLSPAPLRLFPDEPAAMREDRGVVGVPHRPPTSKCRNQAQQKALVTLLAVPRPAQQPSRVPPRTPPRQGGLLARAAGSRMVSWDPPPARPPATDQRARAQPAPKCARAKHSENECPQSLRARPLDSGQRDQRSPRPLDSGQRDQRKKY